MRVRQRAIGLNFIDIYFRNGLYKAEPPFIAGNEGAGEVTAVGPGVTGFHPGDRVGYYLPLGCCRGAQRRRRRAPSNCPTPSATSRRLC